MVTGRDIETGQIHDFTDFAQLHGMLDANQVVILRPDGHAARVQELLDGYVLDGVPLNVAMGGDWDEGQRELMEVYWNSGRIPRPPAELLPPPPPATLGAEPVAAEVVEPAAPVPMQIEGRTLAIIGAAAALGYLLGRGGS